MDELISSIVILIDTREQKSNHITDYFDRKNIAYKKKALKFGDYSFMLPANESLSIPRDLYFTNSCVIERKASLEEISGNLTNGRDRFENTYATYIKCKNNRTGEEGYQSFNMLGRLLKSYEFEQLNNAEL